MTPRHRYPRGGLCAVCGKAFLTEARGQRHCGHACAAGAREKRYRDVLAARKPPLPLAAGSSPVPRPGARRLRCQRYAGCLAHAMRMNWPDFACNECAVDETEQAQAILLRRSSPLEWA